MNRQLLPGDIGDIPTRQMLLRALLDEDMLEKGRKKEERKELKSLQAEQSKRAGQEAKQKLSEGRQLTTQKKKEETAKCAIFSVCA